MMKSKLIVRSLFVFVLLVIAEFGIRIVWANAHFTPPVFESSRGGDYSLIKNVNSKSYQFGRILDSSTDDTGHRLTLNSASESNQNKIHLVGDSQVFGWGLNNTETIATQLSVLLGGGWQVVNHGLPGIGPLEYAKQFKYIPEDEPIIVFFTEENDLWDMYNLGKNATADCGFLIGTGGGLISSLPCSVKKLRLVQLIISQLDKYAHRNRPTPLGFTQNSHVVSVVLRHRLNNTLEAMRVGRKQILFTTVIPWRGRWDLKSNPEYSPKPFDAADIPLLFYDDFAIIAAFNAHGVKEQLYIEGDSHISALGAKFIAQQIYQQLLE